MEVHTAAALLSLLLFAESALSQYHYYDAHRYRYDQQYGRYPPTDSYYDYYYGAGYNNYGSHYNNYGSHYNSYPPTYGYHQGGPSGQQYDYNRYESYQRPSVPMDEQSAMEGAKAAAESTRAMADLVDSVKSTSPGAADLFFDMFGTSASTASGNGMRDVGKTLDGLSALMRGTANLMEQGTGTMLKIRDHFN